MAATAYVFFPYRFVEIYVRGAFPEFLALSLLPLVLWAFYQLMETGRKSFFIVSSFSLAAVILAHNFIAFIFAPVLIGFLAVLLPLSDYRRAIKTGLSLILGVGLASFFLVPVLLEGKYLASVEGVGIFKSWLHFLNLSDLWDCQWGYRFSERGVPGTMCFQLGKINLLLGLAPLILIGSLKKKQRLFLTFFLLLVTGAVFMTLPVSRFLWEKITYLAFGLFPWRFLTLSGLGLSLSAGGSVLFLREERTQKVFAVVMSALLVAFNLGFLKPQNYFPLKDENFATQENIERFFVGRPEEKSRLYSSASVPLWVKKAPQEVPASKIETEEETEIEEEKILPTFYSFKLKNKKESLVKINTFYFPGWKVLVDGKETKIEIDEEGTINFSVPEGEHQVKVVFGRTEPRRIGEIASGVSFLLILALGILL